jgi:hypothetical protein
VCSSDLGEEVKELKELNVPSFNMYSEAGLGLARHALDAMALQKA